MSENNSDSGRGVLKKPNGEPLEEGETCGFYTNGNLCGNDADQVRKIDYHGYVVEVPVCEEHNYRWEVKGRSFPLAITLKVERKLPKQEDGQYSPRFQKTATSKRVLEMIDDDALDCLDAHLEATHDVDTLPVGKKGHVVFSSPEDFEVVEFNAEAGQPVVEWQAERAAEALAAIPERANADEFHSGSHEDVLNMCAELADRDARELRAKYRDSSNENEGESSELVDSLATLSKGNQVRLTLDAGKTYEATVSKTNLTLPQEDEDYGVVNYAFWAADSHVKNGDLPKDDLGIVVEWTDERPEEFELTVWDPTEDDVDNRQSLGTLNRVERIETDGGQAVNANATDAAIEEFQSALRPAIEQAECKGVPPAAQAAVFMQFAYAQFQRSDYLNLAFEQWAAMQRDRADERQLVEGLLYEIERVNTDRDSCLVANTADIPRSDGRIPWFSYDDRPPETILDGFWKCPHCRETMPTLYELWRYAQNKERCLDHRNKCEHGTREWYTFNEGVQEFQERINELTAGLDHETRMWAMEVVRDVF